MFHLWSISSWLAAFNLVFEKLFFPYTLFTVFYTNNGCLSRVFLILLIWSWTYSSRSCLYVFAHFIWVFLSFCKLTFVRFLLFNKDIIFVPSRFSRTANDSPGNSTFGSWFSWNALGCCCSYYMCGNKVLLFVIRNMSFKCILMSIKLFSYC